MTEELDKPRKNLLAAVAASPQKLTLKELSTRCGKNDAYLQQYVHRGTPRVLPEIIRRQLSLFLEIDEALLMSDDQMKIVGKPSGSPIRRQAGQHLEARDLPIMGRARAATDDALIMEGGMVGMTERPAYLAGVEDAFAIYISGDSMYPRFKHGELGYINPHKPPATGDDILIEFEDGTGIVKELVRRTASKLIVKQHNPAREITLDARKIKRISLIEGSRYR